MIKGLIATGVAATALLFVAPGAASADPFAPGPLSQATAPLHPAVTTAVDAVYATVGSLPLPASVGQIVYPLLAINTAPGCRGSYLSDLGVPCS
jgi:hypothetical protein